MAAICSLFSGPRLRRVTRAFPAGGLPQEAGDPEALVDSCPSGRTSWDADFLLPSLTSLGLGKRREQGFRECQPGPAKVTWHNHLL